MRPSTSTIFRNYEQTFKQDTSQLEQAIAKLKADKAEKLAAKEKAAAVVREKAHIPTFKTMPPQPKCKKVRRHPGNCSWDGVNCTTTQNSLNKDCALSRRSTFPGMNKTRMDSVMDGWRKQNAQLEDNIDKAVTSKHSTKQELRDKCEEIFTLRSQNQKLEQILLKCQNQLNLLIQTQQTEDENHRLAETLGNRVGDFKLQARDLRIQLEDVKTECYDIKSERNQLMIENHNLREENKRLEEKLNSVEQNTNKTDSELRRIQTLLTLMDLEPGEPDDNDNKLHEVPSVATALNRLKEHHEDNCEIMTSQIQSMKRQAQSRADEIGRLKSAIHEMTAPGR
jgi:regulator of replication initiation timing